MRSVIMVCCATAICMGIRGWWLPMWLYLGLATVVALGDLMGEAK